MNNIYETPSAELDEKEPLSPNKFNLYKVSGIGLATFFGSPIAGSCISTSKGWG